MARGEGGRLVYADLLRVAATLAVVILHLSGGWISEVPVASGAWRVHLSTVFCFCLQN